MTFAVDYRVARNHQRLGHYHNTNPIRGPPFFFDDRKAQKKGGYTL